MIEVSALTDIGNVRKINQDNILHLTNKDFGVFAVADGMGGLTDGHIASSIAVNGIEDWWNNEFSFYMTQPNIDSQVLIDELNNVFANINQAILSYANESGARTGTTLTVMLIFKNRYIIVHAGDSRVYLHKSRILTQLTEDHTWVSQQVKQGKMTEEQSHSHPKRNALVNCLGAKDDIYTFQSQGEMQNNSVFLICSDGLYNYCSNKDIIDVIAKNKSLDKAKDILLQKCKSNGARDNVSIILIKSTEETSLLKKIFAKKKR